MPDEPSSSALGRVLQRHESSRGLGEAHDDAEEDQDLPGELPEPAPAAYDDADPPAASRPGTARRLAAAERTVAGDLEEREEELRESLERVRQGFDTALSGLREWREQRASEDAEERARLARDLEADSEAALGGQPPSAALEALQEEIRASEAVRADTLLAANGVLRARNAAERVHESVDAAASWRPRAGVAARAHAIVSARVDVDSSTPEGIDALGGEDRALQQTLERELLKKYGLLPDAAPASAKQPAAAAPGASGGNMRELTRIKLELSKYSAGVEYVLSELGADAAPAPASARASRAET